VDNLRFGTTALRRARRRRWIRRLALGLWVLTTLGVVAGTPLARNTAGNVVRGFAGSEAGGSSVQSDALFAGPKPGPEPTETLGQDTEKKKLPEVVAQARKERRRDGGSSLDAAYASGSVTEIISAAATEFGIDPGYMISIAECESGLDPAAYNSAGYHGLFQYDDTTWGAYGYGSIWDPVAQARTTAELLAAGQSSRWPNCA
jgi:Transglycosylase SLT domain